MNLGGFALLLAAVFASGGGAHTAATPGPHTLAVRSAASYSQTSANATPTLSPSGMTGTLTETGPGTWQVRLLLDDSAKNCAGVSGAKAIVAYRLELTIPGAAAGPPIPGKAAFKSVSPPPPTGSSCETTIAFTNINQVPITATLDLDQGGASSAITLTVSRTVTLYYYLGIPAAVGAIMVLIMLLAALRYVRVYTMDGDRVRWRDRAWRLRPLSATGAWSLNDSWATNITTMITLLATILGVTTASGALFPGVALDRFVIVNLVAGGIVAVAPLAFGVLYAGWTRHNPGIMADASLVLPQAVALTLAAPAEFALAGNTPVVLTASGRKKSLRATAVATVDRGTVVRWRGSGTATLPSGASALIPRTAVARHGLPPWPARVTLAADANATLDSVAPADAGQVPAAVVDAPSGADVMLPGGATVTAIDDGRQEPVTVKKGHPVHVPPQTRISILAGAIMTIPGTPDITVDTASILVVSRSRTGGGPGGGTGGSLTIPSDDVDPGKGTAADATVAYPARIEAAAGAKVTVAGVVDVTLPAGTISRASYRAEARLVTERALQVPAGANVLFGNLQMILAVAVVTMFGIGAEIGIAGVLAYGLSEAGQPWRVGMLAVIALVGLLTIAYAVTAIRAIADPRPGSSISSTSGTSFTL